MEIIKATPLQFAHLVSHAAPQRPRLTLVAKATFALTAGELLALAPDQVPCASEAHQDNVEVRSLRYDSDYAVFKPRGECLLAGTCHPPEGKPVPVSGVAFRVGRVSRAFAVFGDRYWASRLFWSKASAPVEFSTMPLRWERSFGGPGYAYNVHGTGLVESETAKGRRKVLPNIEDPKALITSADQKPVPAGSFPLTRAARASTRGIDLDAAWMNTAIPRFPANFDWSFFNAAPVEQQTEGYWKGDEEIVLRNLLPKQDKLKTRLPGLRARCFVQPQGAGVAGLREVPMHLDTITLDTDLGLVFCTWRGTHDVESDQLTDVARVLVTHDTPEARRTIEGARAMLDDTQDRTIERSVSQPTAANLSRPAASRGWTPRPVAPSNSSTDVVAMVARAREEAMQRLAFASRQASSSTAFASQPSPYGSPSSSSSFGSSSQSTPSALGSASYGTPSAFQAGVPSAPEANAPNMEPTRAAPFAAQAAGNAEPEGSYADRFAAALKRGDQGSPFGFESRPAAPAPWESVARPTAAEDVNFSSRFSEAMRAPGVVPATPTSQLPVTSAPLMPGMFSTGVDEKTQILNALPDYLINALKTMPVDGRFTPTFVPDAPILSPVMPTSPARPSAPPSQPPSQPTADTSGQFTQDQAEVYTFILGENNVSGTAPMAESRSVVDLSLDDIEGALKLLKKT